MNRQGLAGNKVARVAACALAVSMFVAADQAKAQQATAGPAAPELSYAQQGWTEAERDTFYTTSQGSHMMPYAWFKALRCQIACNHDPLFAANRDPCEGLGFGLSM